MFTAKGAAYVDPYFQLFKVINVKMYCYRDN